MRYRQLTADGDYMFGRLGNFLVDTPKAVAQAIMTRLMLWAGEWFLDTEEGTPYHQSILGYGTQMTRDLAIRQRILLTPGVTEIVAYSSSMGADRRLVVTCEVSTQYGNANIAATFG